MSAEDNEFAMSKCLMGAPTRTNSDVICELAYESREISSSLDKLKKAIEDDHQSISEHRKNLWRKQAKVMQEYVNVLSERIKDLIDSGA